MYLPKSFKQVIPLNKLKHKHNSFIDAKIGGREDFVFVINNNMLFIFKNKNINPLQIQTQPLNYQMIHNVEI